MRLEDCEIRVCCLLGLASSKTVHCLSFTFWTSLLDLEGKGLLWFVVHCDSRGYIFFSLMCVRWLIQINELPWFHAHHPSVNWPFVLIGSILQCTVQCSPCSITTMWGHCTVQPNYPLALMYACISCISPVTTTATLVWTLWIQSWNFHFGPVEIICIFSKLNY